MKKSPSSAKSTSSPPLYSPSNISAVELRERVRYSETDRMGIAHNKVYFEWFEIGRTEYCRQKGISYASIEDQGIFLVVVDARCRYRKALRYDDEFIIRIFLREANSKKIIFGYELIDIQKSCLIAEGQTIHIPTNCRTEVVSLPESILEKLRA